jgi:hypothetical protein
MRSAMMVTASLLPALLSVRLSPCLLLLGAYNRESHGLNKSPNQKRSYIASSLFNPCYFTRIHQEAVYSYPVQVTDRAQMASTPW